jgi:hypothetical protein
MKYNKIVEKEKDYLEKKIVEAIKKQKNAFIVVSANLYSKILDGIKGLEDTERRREI